MISRQSKQTFNLLHSHIIRTSISSTRTMSKFLSRTDTVEALESHPASSSTAAASSARKLSTTPSFTQTLEGFVDKEGLEDVDESTRWTRGAVPDCYRSRRRSIAFQKLDIRESNDKNGRSEIHLFGVTEAGHSILARVKGFEHYCYYPASADIVEEDLEPLREYLNGVMGTPVISAIELAKQKITKAGKEVTFLKLSLVDHRLMNRLKGIITSGQCEYREQFTNPEHTYEATVPYFLRFMLDCEVKAMTWLNLPAETYDVVPQEEQVSCCQLEVVIQESDLLICDPVDNRLKFAPLRILCFDIETDVPNAQANQFPDPKTDSVFQIGNMVSIYGQETPFIRNVFTLGSCAPIKGSQVMSFDDEKKMLMAWHKFFVEIDPDVVMGYNITQFDIPYLLNRARALKLPQFPLLGRVQGVPQVIRSRYTNFLNCPGYEGRLLLDIFHHIKERFPGLSGEGAYKLNGVSSHFLGQQKEDISYKQIPILQSGDSNTRRELAIYCLKDVYLPLLLLDKLNAFEKEVTESQAARVPFNVMRVWRPLQDVAKKHTDAIAHGYVVPDGNK